MRLPCAFWCSISRQSTLAQWRVDLDHLSETTKPSENIQFLTHALYDLVAHPEYVKEMREEAETMIKAYGWTKNSMQRMRKIDSFLRESQRFTGLGSSKSKPTAADSACTQSPFN